MKRYPIFALILALCIQLPVAVGQAPAGTSSPPQQTPLIPAPADDDDVVRITTNLIQFDVTVTDKDGRPVPDLRPEDFEIFENDKRQEISNFSYIALAPTGVAAAAPKPVRPVDATAPPIPPAILRPEQVRRTIALVVDDIALSYESTMQVRKGVRKYIEAEVQPGDLVAIIRTKGGVGISQQFSSDKRQLLAATERIRWSPNQRAPLSAIGPIGPPEAELPLDDEDTGETNPSTLSQQVYTVSTLGTLQYVLRGLRDLPGRKSIVLMSDGLWLQDFRGTNDQRANEMLARLTDLANRASVVIYSIDARGVVDTGLTAADVGSISPRQVGQIMNQRSRVVNNTRNGLIILAKKTGGFARINDNDVGGSLKDIAIDASGYYLIGYHPDSSTFDAKRLRYNDFKVRLKRKGLNVRYRSGFLGIADNEPVATAPTDRTQSLTKALVSPFNTTDAELQLTSLFGNDAETGSFLRSFLHIRTQDLTFKDQSNGTQQAVFDLMAITFDGNGAPVDRIGRTYTVDLDRETYARAVQSGFTYVTTLPVKVPGAYQLRVAVRDSETNRIGTASQFVEVPDLSKDRLLLSGLAAFGTDEATLNNDRPNSTPGSAAPDQAQDQEGSIANRRMRSGQILQYGCYVFNARLSKAAGRPQLQTQVRIFRDGVAVFTGSMAPYDATGAVDLKRLPVAGALRLGPVLEPGQYVLQVIVTDAPAGEKPRTATQWIDFEIVGNSAPTD
jgi:VWFA-related protein